MANHVSAVKRAKQNEKRRVRNRHVISTCRTLVKKVRAALDASDTGAADAALLAATRAIGAAASKGILHKNNASRRIGLLASAVATLKKG